MSGAKSREPVGPGDFWSRRRAAVAEEERAEVAAEEEARRAAEQEALSERPDAEVLEALGLKDPDELEQGDDFAAFLKAEVPERLKRRALRRLWLSNPVLANVDALVDYGEDFTDSATVVENMQTAYRVGKGMLAHIEKQLETASKDPEEGAGKRVDEADAAGSEDTPDTQAETSAPRVESVADDDAVAPQIEAVQNQRNQSERGALTQEAALPSPRRMRFVYASATGDTS